MITIGRIDKIDLPGMGLENIDAKIDTGARTSAIHCHEIYSSEKDGKKVVHFKLLDPSHPDYNDKEYFFEDFHEKRVKSSSGHVEDRFVIKTKIKIFNKVYTTEFTLTNRKEMTFPILLGRKLLKKRFIVDVSEKNLSFNNKP